MNAAEAPKWGCLIDPRYAYGVNSLDLHNSDRRIDVGGPAGGGQFR